MITNDLIWELLWAVNSLAEADETSRFTPDREEYLKAEHEKLYQLERLEYLGWTVKSELNGWDHSSIAYIPIEKSMRATKVIGHCLDGGIVGETPEGSLVCVLEEDLVNWRSVESLLPQKAQDVILPID